MTDKELVDRLCRIVNLLGSARSRRDWPDMERAHFELRDYVLPGIQTGIQNRRERAEKVERELSVFMTSNASMTTELLAERTRAEKAEAERDEAQHLLIRCVNEGTDGFAGDDVSLEFLRGVPAECAGMKRQRDEFAALVREYAASETPEALETLERDRDRWAKRSERAERERDEARRNLSIARSDGHHDGWRDACLASPLNVDRIKRETIEWCAKVAVDYARDSAGFGDIPADPFAATKRAGEHIAAAILAMREGER